MLTASGVSGSSSPSIDRLCIRLARTNRANSQCKEEGRLLIVRDLYAAIMEGAVERVRPKMMTVSAIMAGLLPILWSSGTGSEVMQRIAVPMVGGMVSSTLLTLIVIPAIYAVVNGTALRRPGVAAPMQLSEAAE